MRSALSKLPLIQDLEATPGTPGKLTFKTSKTFDFRKALDGAVADGVGPLKGYKVLE